MILFSVLDTAKMAMLIQGVLFFSGFQNYSYTQPSFLPEFEGGYFTAWGSGTFYDTVF